MKKTFVEKRFGEYARSMITVINQILSEYVADGYDLSLRQLYYQLVSRNLVENTERSYKNVGTIVSDARLAGLVDWDVIKDRGREMVQNAHWATPSEIVWACSRQFRLDRWERQPVYVEVMVEKQALEGVLIPVCREWDVPFTANKGYSSSSAMYEAGRRLYQKLWDEKRCVVIYLGDHDPSGIDMSRDVEERLRLFAECCPDDDITIDVNRIALNIDQVREMNPPENPAKITDSRAKNYIRRFGRSSWELDAIEPKKLAELVATAIASVIDRKMWALSTRDEEGCRLRLQDVAKRMESA